MAKINLGKVVGSDGREIELINDGTYIKWRYVGDEDWIPLLDVSELGGISVVDEFPDAPDGTVVYLKNPVTGLAPLNTSKIPYRNELSYAMQDAYIEQGGTVGDAGWEDFEENYTNCNYPKGSLKLGTPNCYDLEYIDTGQSFGLSYDTIAFFVQPIMFAVFSEPQDVDYAYFVSNESVTCPHTAGVLPSQEYFFDHMEEFVFVENGETRIRMPLTIMYCFENLTGEVFNTDGMLDGIQLTLPQGWTELNLILNEEFELLRVETSPAVYAPEFYFWKRTTDSASQDTAKDIWLMEAVSEMFTEVGTVKKGLYIKLEGVWKKI